VLLYFMSTSTSITSSIVPTSTSITSSIVPEESVVVIFS